MSNIGLDYCRKFDLMLFGMIILLITSTPGISKVWERDEMDADHNYMNVESVRSVCKRAMKLLDCLISKGDTSVRKAYILVSHGDTAQIIQTQFVQDFSNNSNSTNKSINNEHSNSVDTLLDKATPLNEKNMRKHRSLPHLDPGGWRVLVGN